MTLLLRSRHLLSCVFVLSMCSVVSLSSRLMGNLFESFWIVDLQPQLRANPALLMVNVVMVGWKRLIGATFSSAIVSLLSNGKPFRINGFLDVYLDFLWKHLYFVVIYCTIIVLFFNYNLVCVKASENPQIFMSSLSTLFAGRVWYKYFCSCIKFSQWFGNIWFSSIFNYLGNIWLSAFYKMFLVSIIRPYVLLTF